jgi:hypothetical protein
MTPSDIWIMAFTRVGLEARESGCKARIRWYVLKEESALDSNSGYIASSGHVASLFQDELYEMVSGRAGVARLQLFGVISGYKRVVLYVEPTVNAGSVAPDTTRQRLLSEDAPLPLDGARVPRALEASRDK